LKLKYAEPLSNLGFNNNVLCPYSKAGGAQAVAAMGHGKAVQVEPGFEQLTPCLVSALETKIR